ncbi:MAG: flagellar brake protein [Wujia sp.]
MGLAIGNKIELVLLEQVIKNDPNKKVLVSKIYDFLPNNMLQIAMPIYEGRIIPLEVGEKYSTCFYTNKGLMQCNVVITSRYKKGNLFFLEVLMVGGLNKVQRRAFYRYGCHIDSKVRLVSDNEFTTGVPDELSIPESELDWQTAVMLDISGGGARIAQLQHLERNEVIKIKFSVYVLDDLLHFNLFARILASNRMANRNDLYEQRLEFMKISQEDRDKIIRFIFESERMDRAKEMRK